MNKYKKIAIVADITWISGIVIWFIGSKEIGMAIFAIGIIIGVAAIIKAKEKI